MLAALGAFAPAASAAPAGPKVVIIVGATHGATASYRTRANAAYAEAIKYTSNVVKVYSPNATWSKVKAAVKGASIVIYMGHGNGWPSPVHVRPEVHDEGRLRPQCDGRERRQQQQVLRRALRLHARPRPERGHPPQPPLLRVGQLGAGRQGPQPGHGSQAGRQLRRGVPEGRRPGRHRRRPRRPRAVHPGAVHDPRHDRGGLAERAELPRARERLPVDADRRRDRLHRHRQRHERLLPLAGRSTRPDHRRGHRAPRTPTPASTRRRSSCPATARSGPAGRACTATPPSRPTAAASHPRPFPPARACGRSPAAASRPPPARVRSGSKVSTTRPSTAGCPSPTSSPATAGGRRSGRSTRSAAASRPTATVGSTRPTSPAGSRRWWTGGSASPGSAMPCSTRRPAPATTSMSPGTASTARTPYPDGDYGFSIDAEDDWGNTPLSTSDSIAIDTVPAEFSTITPDASPRTLVLAQRRRQPRHHGMGGRDRRGRLDRLARARW